MVHTNWLVSEKYDAWRAGGIPSFYYFGVKIGEHYCATGSNGGGLHSLVQVAGLSAHRLRAASWYLIFFFE